MSNNANDREVIVSVKHVDISFDTGGKKKFKAVSDANLQDHSGPRYYAHQPLQRRRNYI